MNGLKILRMSLRGRLLQWTIYCAVAFLFLLLYVATYKSIGQQTAAIAQLTSTLPKGLIVAFNMAVGPTTLMGFLVSKHFGLIWPMLVLLVMVAYSGFAIARDVEKKTIGLLLSGPVSRTKLYAMRYLGGVIGLVIFILISEIVTYPLARMMNYAIVAREVYLVGLLGFLLGLAVLSIGFFVSALSNSVGKVYGWLGGILVVMYGLFIGASLNDSIKDLQYFSFFHYFNPGGLLGGGKMDGWAVLVFLASTVVFFVLGLIAFNRRDIEV